MEHEDRYLSVKELAEKLKISPVTCYVYVSSKQIPYIKIGRRTIFSERDIDAWLKTKKVQPLKKGRN